MPKKITNKRKGKLRRTLRKNKRQKGGENPSDVTPVDIDSDLSTVMASLPSKIFPRRIDNKLLDAFKRTEIDDAWGRLFTEKWRSQPLENILKRIVIDHDENEAELYDPEILYLLLISRAWMVFFVKDNDGYAVAREVFIRQISDISDSGGFGNLEKNIKHFLHVLSEPKKPDEYNKLMKFMWLNTHLVLSVASYVFDIPPVARTLEFGGGRKKRTSRRKGKKRNKKKTLKRRTRKKNNKY